MNKGRRGDALAARWGLRLLVLHPHKVPGVGWCSLGKELTHCPPCVPPQPSMLTHCPPCATPSQPAFCVLSPRCMSAHSLNSLRCALKVVYVPTAWRGGGGTVIEFALHPSDWRYPLPPMACVRSFAPEYCSMEKWAALRLFPVSGCCKEGCHEYPLVGLWGTLPASSWSGG